MVDCNCGGTINNINVTVDNRDRADIDPTIKSDVKTEVDPEIITKSASKSKAKTKSKAKAKAKTEDDGPGNS
jgi:hypothetical protein